MGRVPQRPSGGGREIPQLLATTRPGRGRGRGRRGRRGRRHHRSEEEEEEATAELGVEAVPATEAEEVRGRALSALLRRPPGRLDLRRRLRIHGRGHAATEEPDGDPRDPT